MLLNWRSTNPKARRGLLSLNESPILPFQTPNAQKDSRHDECIVNLVQRLNQVLAHVRRGRLAKSHNLETVLLGDVVNLLLTALPRWEHDIGSALLDDMAVVALADHFLESGDLEEVHSLDQLGFVGPSGLGVGDNTGLALDTGEVGGEKVSVGGSGISLVSAATLTSRRAVLADDQAVEAGKVSLDLEAAVDAHLVRCVVEDRAEGQEDSVAGDVLVEAITLGEVSPEADASDARVSVGSAVDVVS